MIYKNSNCFFSQIVGRLVKEIIKQKTKGNSEGKKKETAF